MSMKILKYNSDACTTPLYTVLNKCLNDVKLREAVGTTPIFKY